MLTTLFSISFTSCIDTDVDPVVEAIYAAQADLIAAQTAVQNAEAALRQSEALYNEALAAVQNANATYTLEQVEELKIANAEAQVELEENQAELAITLAELLNELNEVGAIQAAKHALDYENYMATANSILKKKMNAEVNLAEAEYMINNGLYSDFAKTALEANVKQAALQVEWQQEYVNELLALIEDPTSMPAQVTAWKAKYAELDALKGEFKAQEVALQAQIDELIEGTDDDRQEFIDNYEDYMNQADTTWVGTDNWAYKIDQLEDENEAMEAAKEGYAAAINAAEEAITNGDMDGAQDLVDAAEGALGTVITTTIVANFPEVAATPNSTPIDPANTLYEKLWNANLVKYIADATFNYYDVSINGNGTTITGLYDDYQTAIANLANEQISYDGDIAGVTGAATIAQGNLTTATNNRITAFNYYEAKRAAFEANESGKTWFDETTPLGFTTAEVSAYPNTKIGDHSDDGLFTTSYASVTGWVEVGTAGSGDYEPTGLSLATFATMPSATGNVAYTGTVSQGASNPAPTDTYWVEVEGDDLSETNAELLEDAVALLGNEIEGEPTKDTTPLGTSDAYAVEYDAKITLAIAQNAVDNFGVALATAKAEYTRLKDIYENQVQLLADATSEKATADGNQTTADGNVTTAADGLGTETTTGPAIDPEVTLYDALYNAELALAKLKDCDVDCMDETIKANLHEISLYQPALDAVLVVLADMKDQYDAYMDVNIDGGGLDADLAAQVVALEYEMLQLKLEKDLIIAERDYVKQILHDINSTEDLDDIRWDVESYYQRTGAGSFQDSMEDLATAEEALAEFMAEAENADVYLAYLQALIDTLDQRYNNVLDLAAEQLRLMDLALGN